MDTGKFQSETLAKYECETRPKHADSWQEIINLFIYQRWTNWGVGLLVQGIEYISKKFNNKYGYMDNIIGIQCMLVKVRTSVAVPVPVFLASLKTDYASSFTQKIKDSQQSGYYRNIRATWWCRNCSMILKCHHPQGSVDTISRAWVPTTCIHISILYGDKLACVSMWLHGGSIHKANTMEI